MIDVTRGSSTHDQTHRVYGRTFDEDTNAGTTGCPECDGQVVTNARETTCVDCGLVLADDRVDRGPEWRWADEKADVVRRTGAPRTVARHDDGLSTEIGSDAPSNASGRQQAKLARLRTQHDRTKIRSKRERNCTIGLTEIRRIAGHQEITRATRDRACRLFRRAQRDDELRGRSVETMAAGAVYAACRLEGEVRTVEEVATPAQCPVEKVRLGYRTLLSTYDLPVRPYPLQAWVGRVASACDLGPRATKRARDLAGVAQDADLLSGCQARGVAAACVYLASQAHPPAKRQRDVAAAAGTTPVTLRARMEEIEDVVDDVTGSGPDERTAGLNGEADA